MVNFLETRPTGGMAREFSIGKARSASRTDARRGASAEAAPALPKQRFGPQATLGDRIFIDAVIDQARTGIPWRDLPAPGLTPLCVLCDLAVSSLLFSPLGTKSTERHEVAEDTEPRQPSPNPSAPSGRSPRNPSVDRD